MRFKVDVFPKNIYYPETVNKKTTQPWCNTSAITKHYSAVPCLSSVTKKPIKALRMAIVRL